MDYRLLRIIACPTCNGRLYFSKKKQVLICQKDNLVFPLHHGIPVLLEDQARKFFVEKKIEL